MTAQEIVAGIDAGIATIRKAMDEGADEIHVLHLLHDLDCRYKLDIRQRLALLGYRPQHGWDPVVHIT